MRTGDRRSKSREGCIQNGIGEFFNKLLGIILLLEGLALVLFSQMAVLTLSIATWCCSVCSYRCRKALYLFGCPLHKQESSGGGGRIVGAGGNAGAVAAGFLFRTESLTWPSALLILGILVTASSSLALVVRFSPDYEAEVRREMETRFRVEEPKIA
jgi:NNP family nitrate/nitrite transporter-like MFS transporter